MLSLDDDSCYKTIGVGVGVVAVEDLELLLLWEQQVVVVVYTHLESVSILRDACATHSVDGTDLGCYTLTHHRCDRCRSRTRQYQGRIAASCRLPHSAHSSGRARWGVRGRAVGPVGTCRSGNWGTHGVRGLAMEMEQMMVEYYY